MSSHFFFLKNRHKYEKLRNYWAFKDLCNGRLERDSAVPPSGDSAVSESRVGAEVR